MTVITVTAPFGRIDLDQRKALASSLTDAVLVPEIGHQVDAARVGFQVHFVELDSSHMAIGGRLLSETGAEAMVVDVAVMDGAWPKEVRAQVVDRLYLALTKALGVEAPSPTWWVTFRVIDEGSWGSRGGVLSILDLLATGVFTAQRADEIRKAITP